MSVPDKSLQRRFQLHIFVCTNERAADHPKGSCKAKGSEQIVTAFKMELVKRGLKGKVRAQSCGCLDACATGPSVVIYPSGIWYGRVSSSDVPEILDSFCKSGINSQEI